jgi:hypothetical protein
MKKQVIVYRENSGLIEKMRAKSLIFPVLLTLIERGGGRGGRNGGNVTVWSQYRLIFWPHLATHELDHHLKGLWPQVHARRICEVLVNILEGSGRSTEKRRYYN